MDWAINGSWMKEEEVLSGKSKSIQFSLVVKYSVNMLLTQGLQVRIQVG